MVNICILFTGHSAAAGHFYRGPASGPERAHPVPLLLSSPLAGGAGETAQLGAAPTGHHRSAAPAGRPRQREAAQGKGVGCEGAGADGPRGATTREGGGDVQEEQGAGGVAAGAAGKERELSEGSRETEGCSEEAGEGEGAAAEGGGESGAPP